MNIYEELTARGLVAYSSADTAILAGHRSEDIETLLGFRGRDEVIHRDDLVILRKDWQAQAAQEAS